jgi:hypothetical protein
VAKMNRVFLRLYAWIIISLLNMVIGLSYDQTGSREFSSVKHDKMVRLDRLAARVFELFMSGISKEDRYSYTIKVYYEVCKLLIRPFYFQN